MSDRTPDRVSKVLSEIAGDATMNDGVTAVMERATEFETPLPAKLTGVALNERASDHFNNNLDAMWAANKVPSEVPEVIIGSGLHAAIYAAVRVRMGHPKPLVLEAQERAGGAFGVSRRATFFLNSRNRPGNLGVPGREEALNFLPGAPVQPADLNGDEYQTNSALAFSIRATLAMYARVITGQEVIEADSTSVTLKSGKMIRTARVIYATGLGKSKTPQEADGQHLVDYMQFMRSLDQPFPLKGLKSVAVVGCGDSGRTAIEALLGQGPTMAMSAASLDFIEKIDWYGVPEGCRNKQGWEESNRSRYKGIGRSMPAPSRSITGRINPLSERASNVAVGFDGAYIDGARYDRVIWATGFEPMEVADMSEYRVGGRPVARMKESGVFVIGPASQLPRERESNVVASVPENTVALFRYADRTAAFAMSLPTLELPKIDSDEPKKRAKKRPSGDALTAANTIFRNYEEPYGYRQYRK